MPALVTGLVLSAVVVDAAVDSPDTACLFTQTEAAALLGAGTGPGEPYEVRMGSRHVGWSCRYARAPKSVHLVVMVERGDAARFAQRQKLAQGLAQPHQFRLLEGVGDAAFIGQGRELQVLAGDRILVVQHVTLAAGRVVGDDEILAFARIGVERMAKVRVTDRPA